MTINEIAALPPADVEQQHLAAEMDERFQEGLHLLAVRCGECGQPLPAEGR